MKGVRGDEEEPEQCGAETNQTRRPQSGDRQQGRDSENHDHPSGSKHLNRIVALGPNKGPDLLLQPIDLAWRFLGISWVAPAEGGGSGPGGGDTGMSDLKGLREIAPD